ncbi:MULTISPECIES: hypothetical protein [Nocardia]|uniref:hypothetical protein n=1 Tax=Nocardia TaxID=1817 RepID=UPI0019822499|nr:hypothetical protein [Nocardia mangyaensis]
MPSPSPDSPMVVVANTLIARLDELTDELVARIADQVEFYRMADVVSRAQLRRSTWLNLDYLLQRLGQHAPELVAPRQTGRERAE